MLEYPDRLIPKSHYTIMDSVTLMSQKGLCLIRHVDSEQATFIGNTKTLNPDCIKIQSGHMRDLSNNLLGIFQIEDVYWGVEKSVNGVYCSPWNGSEQCTIPSEGHYFRDENRGYYFIPVDNLLSENIDIINITDNTADSFHFKILHTPTKCNYWHISIRVYDSNNQEVSSLETSKRKKERIWKAVKDFLVTSIVTTEKRTDNPSIPLTIYCRS